MYETMLQICAVHFSCFVCNNSVLVCGFARRFAHSIQIAAIAIAIATASRVQSIQGIQILVCVFFSFRLQ